ncbi:MAG TPA: patatin-like phospholipase family protein [Solirubrobacteraceae bacterium]|jgi:NTE family protein
METPDALVLGGGGTLGEAWMWAVLAGAEQDGRFDARACGAYVGTSAGSIVAALLVAGVEPRARLERDGAGDAIAGTQAENERALAVLLGTAADLALAAIAPLAPLALASAGRPRQLLARTILRAAPTGRRSLRGLSQTIEQMGASFDGRLRVVAVELASGRRIAFGDPGAPELGVGLAVEASCAIPGVFRPVEAAGSAYVDGGVWSPTNIDVAPVRRGGRILCLNPTGSLRPTLGSPAGAFGPVSRAIARAEGLAMRQRSVQTRTVNPDRASAAAMGVNLMDARRRSDVIEAGLAQGRRLAEA